MQEVLFTNLQIDDLTKIIEDCILNTLGQNQLLTRDNDEVEENLLSIEDLVKMFNVSKVTIHKWKKKGIIPFYKMNRRVYFKKSEIIESMAHKKRKLEI